MPQNEPTTAQILQQVQAALEELLELIIKKLKAKNARNYMAAALDPYVLASVGTVTSSNPSDSTIDASGSDDLDGWLTEAEDECELRLE